MRSKDAQCKTDVKKVPSWILLPKGLGKRGHIVAATLLLMMFLGLLKLGNICCGHKMFLNKIRNIFCVPDKIYVRNKCCACGQTGKHFCWQQCFRNNVSSFEGWALSLYFGNFQYAVSGLELQAHFDQISLLKHSEFTSNQTGKSTSLLRREILTICSQSELPVACRIVWLILALSKCPWLIFTEADKGQSQNIYEIRKTVFKIRKNILNRNGFWKSSLKSLSNLKNYYKS